MYQLVLQFAPWGGRPLDDLIALENRLLAPDALGPIVDGHDIGMGEANIFIITSDPQAAFDRALPFVEAFGIRHLLGAGIRDIDGDSFIRCWPRGDTSEFVVQ